MKRYRLNILYEDANLCVVVKPAGVESQSSKGLTMDMVSLIRNHLSTGGDSNYIGVIHRLDKPVSGIMVFAKDKNTAKWLSKQFLEKQVTKRYQAIVCGKVPDSCGQLRDNLEKSKNSNQSYVSEDGGKEASLKYTVMEYLQRAGKDYTKLEITLATGRHHQIRVQFANAGFPLAGDRKYGEDGSSDLALKSVYLKFYHEKKRQWMEFEIEGLSYASEISDGLKNSNRIA